MAYQCSAVLIPGEKLAGCLAGGSPRRRGLPKNPQNQEDFLQSALAASDERAKVFPAVRHVGDAYAALDVLLLASENEGFGLVIAEAWLAGLPVVCTGVGIVREIEQEVGWLVTRIEHDSPPSVIAAAVREALSPAGRVKAQKARKIAWDRFTAAAMAHRWESYLLANVASA